MYDENRMERIKELMQKYGKNKSARRKPTIDTRPASAMVGQKNCEGFMPDESGKLVRIENDIDTADYVGPGSYDPTMPTSCKNVRISHAYNRFNLVNTNVKPGPCDYCHKPSETKITHSLTQNGVIPEPPAPLSGTLEHKSWLPQQISNLPQAKYPNAQFKTELSTNEFASTTNRELWPKKMYTPSPTAHAPQAAPIVYEDESAETPEFKSRFERFKYDGPNTPDPTAYTLPDAFGTSPTKKIVPPSQFKRPPPEPTPDGATYAPPIINKPDTRHKDHMFMTKRGRFWDNSFQTPPCTKYNISRNSNDEVTKVRIRSKVKRPYSEWDEIPQTFNPGVGSYSPETEARPKSGYISTIGHRPYETMPDRPLAFNTQHASFIHKSFNARYAHLG
ncbi:hypothetical protein TRFO_25400 [Tritrichomonas foetus]|uniref:Uncharacterized protein n=1 Tax=Tritrichomonas foetus TaxID=1144522 RepID=A0A1J4K553_9EUKA|nr:hypothetical protein TRFO_25400 [Tritrichomonas foetus]|eukprot:OHT06519.1 hypothetical protein TRFO_25400 [Tritrichomonas foetus]